MKVITIKQPWAGLIFVSGKNVENRTWATSYRGILLVHASLRATQDEDALRHKRRVHDDALAQEHDDAWRCGAIIGAVELYDCVRNATGKWAHRDAYHWRLRNARLFAPVAARGRLGLWSLDALDAKSRRAVEKQM